MFIHLLSFFVTSPWQPVTEEVSNDRATLTCRVATHGRCTLKVQLSFSGTNEQGNVQRRIYSCHDVLELPSYDHKYKDQLNSLKCKVKVGEAVQEFAFHPRPSGEKPNEFLVFFFF